MDQLLYGSDPKERIVGIAAHGDSHVRIWTRDKDDVVDSEIQRVHPWLYTDPRGIDLIKKDIGPHSFKSYPMGGKNTLNILAIFPTMEIFRKGRKALYADPTACDRFFTYGDPATMYLVHSGRTMLKELTPKTAHRMQIDIESFRDDGFPNADQDPIFIISICDNRGYEQVLFQVGDPHIELLSGLTEADYKENPWTGFQTEQELLTELVKIISRRDPDIIEGHYIFGFDLPYIERRCVLNNVHFTIGRDALVPYTHPAEKKFAERDVKYTNFVVGGRSIIDTMFLAMDWDVYARKLKNVTLKEVARTFGVAPKNRTYIDGDKIAETWLKDPTKVLRYALDDVYETRAISDQLCSSSFALTQMMPLPYQKVQLAGSSTRIQSLFVREYLRKRQSLPLPSGGKQEFGGYTDIFQTGIFDNIWYLDVDSLYPAIMLNYDMKPEHDHLGLFQTFLQALTTLRLETKATMQKAKGIRKAELKAREQAFKIQINSFYGMLGAGKICLFSTVSEADRVATTGQGLLKRMIELVVAEGGDIIECDTDGVMFITPPELDFEKDGPAFAQLITDKMPKGINISLDGAYLQMMSMKKKNYALMKLDGEMKVKGGSFKSRALEPLFRVFVEGQIECLFDRDTKEMRAQYIATQETILTKVNPELLARSVALKDSLKTYERKVRSGSNRAPQYEIADALVRVHNRRVQKGDRISYVVCGTEMISKVRSYNDAQATEFVKPGTHHTKFYLRKLYGIARKRFGTFFADDDLIKIYPKAPPADTIDMFGGVDFAGVSITNKRIKDIGE